MRLFTVLVLLLLTAQVTAPAIAVAGRVVVIPAVFISETPDDSSNEASEQVNQAVLWGVRDADLELADPTDVKRAQSEIIGERGVCRDAECLAQVAEALGADEAIFVQVTENSETDRRISLVLAHGEAVDELREDGFMVVLENVRRLVALSLKKSIIARAGDEPMPKPATETEPRPTPETDPGAQPAFKSEPKPDHMRLSPLPFYISAGITGALALSWVITESVGYSKQRDLEAQDTVSPKETDDLRPIQTADRVFLGLSLAGAVTTVALFFFTDFDREVGAKKRLHSTSLRLVPAPTPRGGMLGLEGRF